MSFHPNDIARRARGASVGLAVIFIVLLSAFFRTQVLRNSEYALQSESNRLREVPIPAPRGIIYDRNGRIIAENVPGYSVSILSPTSDSLHASLVRLGRLVPLDSSQVESVVRRFRRAPNRPTVILADASFDVVSVLEEHRIEFPDLVIQSAPKRFYPDSTVVASIVGYVGEVTEGELAKEYAAYKAGQQIGKGGLEKQYESELRGREGMRFVEVDARGRVVSEKGARDDLRPRSPEPLYTNIDLDLQRFTASVFGDSLQGGLIAMEPRTGEVLALYSAPSFDPNRFIGGIPTDYWRELNTDPRRPLYNKVIQGRYPPASTFKLALAVLAMERGLIDLDDYMPQACTGGYMYGTRYFRCWDRRGHGSIPLARAIEVSCNVYFYQLGLKVGLSRLLAGGVSLGFAKRSGIDLPNEQRPLYPDAVEYYNKRYGPRRWSNAVVLNLSIGQGENNQTVASMARFYSALATDGRAAKPEIVRRNPEREQVISLTPAQMQGLRNAMAGVISARGTAGSARIESVVLAGKTGTAQNSQDRDRDHAWFVGFAPAEDPKIVVAVMLEFGEHGYSAARVASRVIAHYLKTATTQLPPTEG
ncbi:MAG: penicillin-binding protein 2 [Gemmatimonadota bacterium]|nr:penicillin-binding protein 2 [Gemmatimonadota bacterium]